ncbi:MAG: hypothetical protein QG638_1631, partial [Pseudomonadota bacterium]|nr:hypothetical protein [Pseudomonadota bacterium]
ARFGMLVHPASILAPMPLFESLSILVLGLLAWLWHDSLKAREAGVREARAACADEDLQLLDDTVAIRSFRPARDDAGRLRLQRTYAFEYSDTGDNRRQGSVTLLGQDVVMVSLRARLTLVGGAGGDRHEQH